MADPNPTLSGHRAHGSWSGDYRQISVGPQNTVVLLVCNTCHFIEAYCNHDHNTWDAEGTTLTCDFCGIDGT